MAETINAHYLFTGKRMVLVGEPEQFSAALLNLPEHFRNGLIESTARKYVALDNFLPLSDAHIITSEGRPDRETLSGLRLGIGLLTGDVEASITQASSFFQSLSEEARAILLIHYAFGEELGRSRD